MPSLKVVQEKEASNQLLGPQFFLQRTDQFQRYRAA